MRKIIKYYGWMLLTIPLYAITTDLIAFYKKYFTISDKELKDRYYIALTNHDYDRARYYQHLMFKRKIKLVK